MRVMGWDGTGWDRSEMREGFHFVVGCDVTRHMGRKQMRGWSEGIGRRTTIEQQYTNNTRRRREWSLFPSQPKLSCGSLSLGNRRKKLPIIFYLLLTPCVCQRFPILYVSHIAEHLLHLWVISDLQLCLCGTSI